MSDMSSFKISKRPGVTGRKSCNYEYILNGVPIGKGVTKISIDFLPAQTPQVTIVYEPVHVDIDVEALVDHTKEIEVYEYIHQEGREKL